MPGTLKRSPKKAQDTYVAAHDSAVEQYGEGERAHRTAFSAVKHSFEKVGDHWEPKGRKGPSDAKAAGGRDTPKKTAGGVDANASKDHLLKVAKKLDVSGRSSMSSEMAGSRFRFRYFARDRVVLNRKASPSHRNHTTVSCGGPCGRLTPTTACRADASSSWMSCVDSGMTAPL